MSGPMLMLHKGVTFRDQVVYATGHAYEGCTFERCTIVCLGMGPGAFSHCSFATCVWHLSLVVHDGEQWDHFMSGMAAMITKSLPRTA